MSDGAFRATISAVPTSTPALPADRHLERAADGLAVSAALAAALDTGLLGTLEAQPGSTAAGLAERADLDAEATRIVLEVLAWCGIVTHQDDRWEALVGTEAAAALRASHAGLPTLLRTGSASHEASDTTQAALLYPPIVATISRLVDPHIGPMAAAIARPGGTALEVACGAAPWGRALRAAEPTMHVTLLDLPDVLARTAPGLAGPVAVADTGGTGGDDAGDDDAGQAGGFELVSGDVFEVDLARTFDVVVVAGFCRLLGPDANRRLFRRVAGWCRVDGEVVVADAVATEAARRDGLALYELGLRTRTSVGRTWSLDDYAHWLGAAGLADIRVQPTDVAHLTVLRARPKEAFT